MSDVMFDKCYRCNAVIVSSATDVAQTITALRALKESKDE